MASVLSKDFVTVEDTKDVRAIIIPVMLLNTFYFSLNNMRKFLLVAPSFLIVVALISYANAKNKMTSNQMKMTGNQKNITGRQMNMTNSQMNITGSQMNMTGSQMNMTGS